MGYDDFGDAEATRQNVFFPLLPRTPEERVAYLETKVVEMAEKLDVSEEEARVLLNLAGGEGAWSETAEIGPGPRVFKLNQNDMRSVSREIHEALLAAGFTEDPAVRQTLALAEEVGEFVGAVRRWSGRARRTGPFSDVEDELADVVITAWVTSHTLDIDLEAAINRKLGKVFSRGWRDDPDGDV